MSSIAAATNIYETELDGRTIGGAVRLGVVLGVPTFFLAVLTVSLLGGAPLASAVSLAALPALVGGPYFGSLIMLSRLEERRHLAEVAEMKAHHRHDAFSVPHAA